MKIKHSNIQRYKIYKYTTTQRYKHIQVCKHTHTQNIQHNIYKHANIQTIQYRSYRINKLYKRYNHAKYTTYSAYTHIHTYTHKQRYNTHIYENTHIQHIQVCKITHIHKYKINNILKLTNIRNIQTCTNIQVIQTWTNMYTHPKYTKQIYCYTNIYKHTIIQRYTAYTKHIYIEISFTHIHTYKPYRYANIQIYRTTSIYNIYKHTHIQNIHKYTHTKYTKHIQQMQQYHRYTYTTYTHIRSHKHTTIVKRTKCTNI